MSVSAYSNVSLIRHLIPLMRPGGSFQSLTYMASERAIPGYGGGMSSAKAALESDTRTLAMEVGRQLGFRINTISAGPLASRAASAIGKIDRMIDYCRKNSPIDRDLTAMDVGHVAAFLASPMAAAITATTLYVDNGYHSMGMGIEAPVLGATTDMPAPRGWAAAGAVSGGSRLACGRLRGTCPPRPARRRRPGDLRDRRALPDVPRAGAAGRRLDRRGAPPGAAETAGWGFVIGTVLFSGSLYS